MRSRRAAWLVSALVALPALAAADDGVKVIPPGNEKLLLSMLGNDPPLPSGCKLEGIEVDRSLVRARYACPNRPEASLWLAYPGAREAAGAQVKTERFALVFKGDADQALVDAITSRVKAGEGPWRWVSAEAEGLGKVAPEGALPPADSAQLTPAESDELVAAARLYREQKYPAALEAFVTLARRNPRGGVLGMIVASVASSLDSLETPKRYAAEADAHPGDPLAQFLAGVSSHYGGHRLAATVEEKKALYRQAVKYLERTRPAFDFEPRVFVYLAVSHFRLGHDDEAKKLIDQAVPLATNDPDVYYCRAEIAQRRDLPAALADIDRYLAMTDELKRQGIEYNEQKHERVKQMRAAIDAARQKGTPLPPDDALFDPVQVEQRTPPKPARAPVSSSFASPGTFALGAVAVGLLAAGLGAVASRKKPSPPA